MRIKTEIILNNDYRVSYSHDKYISIFDHEGNLQIELHGPELVHALDFLVPAKEYTDWVVAKEYTDWVATNQPPLPNGDTYVEDEVMEILTEDLNDPVHPPKFNDGGEHFPVVQVVDSPEVAIEVKMEQPAHNNVRAFLRGYKLSCTGEDPNEAWNAVQDATKLFPHVLPFIVSQIADEVWAV